MKTTKKMTIILSAVMLLMSCETQEENKVENSAHDEINAAHKYRLAVIDYELFTNELMTPGKNAPEKWEVSEQFRDIVDRYPALPYADSAQIYLDSLKSKF